MLFLPVSSGYVMPDPLTCSFCPHYSYFKHLQTKILQTTARTSARRLKHIFNTESNMLGWISHQE